MHKITRFAVGALGLFLLSLPMAAQPASADVPGQHPRYVHAISDLQVAQSLLNRPEEYRVEVDQQRAVQSISQALYETGQAAVDDAKPLQQAFPPDINTTHMDRLRQARRLLEGVQRDLNLPETNPAARQWQAAAINDVTQAMRFVDKAIRDDHYSQWNRGE